MKQKFSKVICFTEEDIQLLAQHLHLALIGKFLGKSFSLDFIEKELHIRWGVQGDFHDSALFVGLLLF